MQTSYLFINGIRIHYYRWDSPEGSRPLLLLHGLASNARIWELVAPILVQEGLSTLAPDSRGHGLSDKPDGDYGFEVFSRDLAAFIETCYLERPVLVGHSWGASVALDYAARVTRGPWAPAGIVMVDGGVIQMNAVPGATWESMRDRLTPPRLAGMPLEKFLAHLTFKRNGGDYNDSIIPIILANFEIDAEEKIYPRLTLERHMQIVRALWEFEAHKRIQSTSCPVLAILAKPAPDASQDQLDFLAIKEGAVAQLKSQGAKLEVQWMPDAIHDIPLQKPVELARSISEFCKSLP